MIYFIANSQTNNVKIGYTKNVKERLVVLNNGNDSQLTVLKILDVDRFVEDLILEKFKQHNVKGEWFTFNEDLKRFINDIPCKNKKNIVKFIEDFKLTENCKLSDNVNELSQSLKLITIHEKLETAVGKSRNSGFTDGLRFAQRIIKQYIDK